MSQTIWILSVALIGAGIVIGQVPQEPLSGQSKGRKERPLKKAQSKGQVLAVSGEPAQSPASQPRPQTGKAQTYPIEQIHAGELRFTSQCGFCHGRDAAGGETGPDLTRSVLVAGDVHGDRIGPLLREGRPEKGMPAFELGSTELGAIVAFVHSQKTKFETVGGGRRSVDAADLATGDAMAGLRYFNGAGGCSACHSATGDLAGIATRYQGLKLLQRMLYPSGQPAPARPKVTLTLASGETLVAQLAGEDEFTIVVEDSEGARQTYERSTVTFKIDDRLPAHFDQLARYNDGEMHNVFAYLDTLK